MLGGLITGRLKEYCNIKLCDSQYGFRAGRNIDGCKADVIVQARRLV
jgi:hypothetical protein